MKSDLDLERIRQERVEPTRKPIQINVQVAGGRLQTWENILQYYKEFDSDSGSDRERTQPEILREAIDLLGIAIAHAKEGRVLYPERQRQKNDEKDESINHKYRLILPVKTS